MVLYDVSREHVISEKNIENLVKNIVNIVGDGREGESCQMVLSNVRPNDPLTAELTRLTVRLPLSSLSRSHTYLFVCNLSEV